MKTKMKLHPRVRALLAEIENDWPGSAQAPTVPERFLTTIQEFCRKNRDGRGLRVVARRDVERTLKHIRSAERKAAGSKALSRKARKLLTSLRHNVRFEMTIEQARGFAGEVQKEGRRSARRAPVCDPEEFRCGTLGGVAIRLCRVVSVDGLMKVGRALHLCVARGDGAGRLYHAELRTGDTEFWTLQTDEGPVALLSVEEAEGTRRVAEFQGRSGRRPRATDEKGGQRVLPGRLLSNVLRSLDATATDQEDFTRVGAFQSLLPAAARASHRDVAAEGRRYRVWKSADEVIIGRLRSGGCAVVQWSRFERHELPSETRRPGRGARKRYEWLPGAWHLGAMDSDRLLELLAQSPGLYKAFRGSPE